MAVVLSSLEPLIAHLRSLGYTVIGPTESDGAIVLSELSTAEQLPYGWGVETGPGTYRLRRRGDLAAFGHSTGPQAWKRFLHPPRQALWTADRTAEGIAFAETTEPATHFAFLGVRPCDLRAIEVQDRVLGIAGSYAERRAGVFLIAVNCTEPSSTCFCVSAGGGPLAQSGFDLVLTEICPDATSSGSEPGDGSRPYYLAASATDAGLAVLDALPQQPARPSLVVQARRAVDGATARMGRALPEGDLHRMLADSLNAARWDEVAARCLTCGNCTMVCPTCFCTSVTDTTDLTGEHSERWQHWASCFETDFSYLHGGAVRTSARSRYRQWLTHKLGTWHDQFGESGCVGCGRCIAWCPVGIDITAEATALAQEGRTTT
jgi:ferredoxin